MVKYLVFAFYWIGFASGAQVLTIGEARKLTPGINSGCEEIFPLLSPDHKALYFVRASCAGNTGGKFAGSDVWISRYDATAREWGKPTNTKDAFNDKSNNAVVGISGDGSTIYQLNTSATKDTPGVYFSKRLDNSWSKPELIPLPQLGSEEFLGLYVPADLDVILISLRTSGGFGQEDLYVSQKEISGGWSSPRNLGSVINTEGFEISPFLSESRKRLYFTSSGHWGMGDGDIFYADRLDESWDNWSTPVSLGSKVNSDKFDAYFSLYDSVAYFSSNRDSEYSDIYEVKLKGVKDSTQLRIQKIVAEAKSLLNDLGDDTSDSLATDLRSIFIGFEGNSCEMSSEAVAKLNSVVARIKHRKSTTVTLVAYLNNAEVQEDNLGYRRLEAVKDYLSEVPVQNLKVEIELRKPGDRESRSRSGLVEVRYEQ